MATQLSGGYSGHSPSLVVVIKPYGHGRKGSPILYDSNHESKWEGSVGVGLHAYLRAIANSVLGL